MDAAFVVGVVQTLRVVCCPQCPLGTGGFFFNCQAFIRRLKSYPPFLPHHHALLCPQVQGKDTYPIRSK